MARIYTVDHLASIAELIKKIETLNSETYEVVITSVTLRDTDDVFLGTIKYDTYEDNLIFTPTLEDTIE